MTTDSSYRKECTCRSYIWKEPTGMWKTRVCANRSRWNSFPNYRWCIFNPRWPSAKLKVRNEQRTHTRRTAGSITPRVYVAFSRLPVPGVLLPSEVRSTRQRRFRGRDEPQQRVATTGPLDQKSNSRVTKFVELNSTVVLDEKKKLITIYVFCRVLKHSKCQ